MKAHLTTVRPPLPEGMILEENVYVTMRDGVRLAADIYRPAKEGKYPGILSMSPYIKEMQQWPPAISHSIEAGNTAFFVPNGYVHVIVSSRGSGLSQGQWSPFDLATQQDGYDMVEWIAQQDWCNESVTMLGDSYFGIMQWLVGLQKPPHLKCIAPADGSTDFYRDYAWKGGLFNTGFFGMWGPDTLAQCFWPGEVEGKLPPADFMGAFLANSEDGPLWWDISEPGSTGAQYRPPAKCESLARPTVGLSKDHQSKEVDCPAMESTVARAVHGKYSAQSVHTPLV
jgi:predicted acyl esterase